MDSKFNKVVNEHVNLPPPEPEYTKPAIVQQAAIGEYGKDVLAALLIGEAGGEGDKGMVAVMNIIQNRSKKNPHNFLKIALKPAQFSIFNKFTIKRDKSYLKFLLQKEKRHPKFGMARMIVDAAIKNKLPDITHGATHYHVYTGSSKVAPSWTHPKYGGRNKRAILCGVLGHHVFLRNI